MRVEVDPKKTSRALAYELWMQAPNPMVTFFKTMDVTELIRISRKRKLKFNTGIKIFTNLQELDCSSNYLTSLDISGCTSLKNVWCEKNNLVKLDVSGCTNLERFLCYENKLSSLDLSGCTNLVILLCSNNQLMSLNLYKCTKLIYLNCVENKLKSLDVSFCPILKEICESTTPEIVNGYQYYMPDDRDQLCVDQNVKILTVHTHTWDTGRVTKAATTTSTGIRTYTCTVCGGTKKGIIPKLKDKITITKKPGIKKPAATKSKITVKWKHFKHTSKKTRKIWKTIKKVQVQCATDSGFSNIVKDVKIGRGKTKYTVKGLAKKTTYYVRVRYFDGTGYSDWSKVKKVKTK